MKQWLMVWLGLCALPLMASACGVGTQTPEGYENVDVHHVYQHWRQGADAAIPFMIVDVRTVEEYKQGHIEGARLMPLQFLKKRWAELPRDRQLYVYCRSGRRSAEAAAFLAGHGYSRVENMVGGIEAWRNAHYPVVH
ncbi:MAG: rhodanese-like domain-containing protein [Zetaproteobacteria bacterium]|nr:MAG: rhodanese-like domain-containing protein [Zetaproteobacteria bacterium]